MYDLIDSNSMFDIMFLFQLGKIYFCIFLFGANCFPLVFDPSTTLNWFGWLSVSFFFLFFFNLFIIIMLFLFLYSILFDETGFILGLRYSILPGYCLQKILRIYFVSYLSLNCLRV